MTALSPSRLPRPRRLKPHPYSKSRSVVLDIEVGRPHDSQPELFMIGILWWDEHGKETVEIIDRNRVRLAEVIDWIRREDRTIVTYAGTGYDIPMLSALLAGDLPAYTASQVAIEAK